MNMSNEIAGRLLQMLEETGMTEFRRNELAQAMGCVPSQITYVVTSRFTPEKGYIVESRRGGDGCVRITRVSYTKRTALMHVVNAVGDQIDETSARSIISGLEQRNLLDASSAKLMTAAVNENCYRALEKSVRNRVRAEVFKRMLVSVME